MTCSDRRFRGASLAVAVAALSASLGCGGAFDASVSGVVSLDGAPVPRGTVSFAPIDSGPTAYGLIGSDGRYVLHTGREEGLPPGEYRVSVVATEVSPPRGPQGGPPPLGKMLTPLWYRDIATSGLSFTVNRGKNQIDIQLNSTPPPGWKPPAPGRR
ncbi:MAG TPA: carboxypeptidase-like regulatory domain-containing protein [Lacipirellulaceae bacterium]|nr:carboxypeptidase-like regulatory domain-containing protein [Lacipirellulaceae bacterium]